MGTHAIYRSTVIIRKTRSQPGLRKARCCDTPVAKFFIPYSVLGLLSKQIGQIAHSLVYVGKADGS